MANSRKPGPANPPMDWCRIPALTPGPLGLFDQGDPNFTTLLGDTPGPLGMNDWNDPTIGCFHNALATLSWDTDDDFMGSGAGGALWPVEPPVNPIARGAHGSSVTGKAAAAGVGGSSAAGGVTDFIAVANTRGSYSSQGLTEYQGKNVAYTTSFNSATGYWEQSTGDGFLINAISWAPRDTAPATPRSAMSFSMTLQSESLYTAGRSFFGDAYRVAVHEVLNPGNTWAIRTGYGLSALVVAIPGFLNDLSRDLYNSPNDSYVGGEKMSAGWANRDPYGFSDGLMRFSTGLLSATGGAAIVEKGIVSNRLVNKYGASNQAVQNKYIEAEKSVEVDSSRTSAGGIIARMPPAQYAEPMARRDLATLYTTHAQEIDNVSTFRTFGLDRAAADDFLSTSQGKQFITELGAADPTADISTIYARAVDQLAAGSGAPELLTTNSPLVKIVPHGQPVSPYSPFFTTAADLNSASKSGYSLADYFGLPLKSESGLYDIYQISPNGPAKVFMSEVAPTVELGGLVSRSGGATQHVVPNRSLWSHPTLIGTIEN